MALPPKTPINDLTDGNDQGDIQGTDGADAMWGGPADGLAGGGAQINDTMSGDGDGTISGGEGYDNIFANGGDLVFGGEDPDDGDIDRLFVQDVGSIDYLDESGDPSATPTEQGVVSSRMAQRWSSARSSNWSRPME
ncbi:MAG: hypothetical protein ACI9AX_001124 [Polaromonas sp.]|jgi:hypothetical protein